MLKDLVTGLLIKVRNVASQPLVLEQSVAARL